MTIGTRTGTVAENSAQSTLAGTLPSGTTTGDVCIAVFAFPGTVAQFTGPSGWTALFTPINIASNTEVFAAYYRVSPPGAPSATTSGGTGRCSVLVQSYTGVDTTTPIDVAAHTTTATAATSVSETGVTTVTANARVVGAAMFDRSTVTAVTPSGYTADAATAIAGGRVTGLASKAQAAAGATGSTSWATTSPSAVDNVAFTVALRPAAVLFSGTAASTTTAAGDLVDQAPGISFTGAPASTTATTTPTLNLGAKLTAAASAGGATGTLGKLNLGLVMGGSRASTTTATAALSTISRVLTGILEIELVAGSGTYTDFSDRLDIESTPLAIRQGRPTVFDDVGSGTLTCSLFNDDGNIMPDNPAASMALTEGMRIRWTVSQSGNDYRRIWGWISDLVPGFPGSSSANIALTAVDALGVLATRKLRSNWTEAALALARANSVHVDALEAAGTAIGINATMTNYSPDTGASSGSYAYGSAPGLTFTQDRDTSCGPVVTSAPNSLGESNKTRPAIQASQKCVQWIVKTPSTQPAIGTPWIISSPHGATSATGIHIGVADNGAGRMKLVVYDVAATSILGTLFTDTPTGQWLLISCQENVSNTGKLDVTATVLADGTTLTTSSISFDVKNFREVEFPTTTGPTSAAAFGGVVAFARRAGLGYEDAVVNGPQGTIAQRLVDVEAACSALPVAWATTGTLTTQVVTGSWSDRYALEVLQELMRSGRGLAWARSRDSVIYAIGSDELRPATPIATIDTDRDCQGPPMLSRSVANRPTRIEVLSPGLQVVRVDTVAEAATNNPQRSKSVTTVCASDSDMNDLGDALLTRITKLRISQMTVDLTTGVTDHAAELFSESGALTGMFPTARVRAIVPTSHFGAPTRDYWLQGWTETYTPNRVTVTMDTDPCTTSTLVDLMDFTGSNGSSFPFPQFDFRADIAASGTALIQGNRGVVTTGANAFAETYARLAITQADIEMDGLVNLNSSASRSVIVTHSSAIPNPGYEIVIGTGGTCYLKRSGITVASWSESLTAVTDYGFRVRSIGGFVNVRVWLASGTEPGTWDLEYQDASPLTGTRCAIGSIADGVNATARAVTYDNIRITDGA